MRPPAHAGTRNPRYGRAPAECHAAGAAFGNGIMDRAELAAALAEYPKVKRVLDTFKGSAGMTKYLTARGKAAF